MTFLEDSLPYLLLRNNSNSHFDLEGHKPVLPSARHGDIFDGAIESPALPEAHPTDFGQIDAIALYGKALGIAKRIAEELLAIGRRLRTTSTQIRVGTIQVFQALL